MFKHPSHRQLKKRTLKRRVSAHHFLSDGHSHYANDYDCQRANRCALNKLKRQPDLLNTIVENFERKCLKSPDMPQLSEWQKLLDNLTADKLSIEQLSEKLMGYGESAQQLRKYSMLDCLYD